MESASLIAQEANERYMIILMASGVRNAQTPPAKYVLIKFALNARLIII